MRRELSGRLLAVAVCICVSGSSISAEQVIYVDAAATGANDGSSWTNAYVALQEALAAAEEVEKPLEIRVAEGTYVTERRRPFELRNGVALKGGYAGTNGVDPNARDVDARVTVLSGYGYPSDERHVVTGSLTDPTAVIDGFTITRATHGAVSIANGSPTLIACRFAGNTQWAALDASDCNSLLVDCRFEGNPQGGILCEEGHLTLTDCVFAWNRNDAILMIGTLELLRCSFLDNRVGAVQCNGKLVARDCTFAGNTQAVYCKGTMTARNCTFAGYRGDSAPVSCSGHGTFTDCRFVNNRAPDAIAGALAVTEGSAMLTRCLFAGNSTSQWGSGAVHSHFSVTQLRHCLFVGNAGGTMGVTRQNPGGTTGPGAIHHYGPILRVSNCTFAGNRGAPRTIRFVFSGAAAELTHSIVRDGPDPFMGAILANYSNIEGGYAGQGNIDVDPGFVVPGSWDPKGTPDDPNDDVWVMGDYHLKSQAGHWDQETEDWVLDEMTSPCIDAGDPNGPLGAEPFPNGGYVNLGAYGGTAEASRSYFGGPVCETQIAGDINGDCRVDDLDLDILTSHWLMDATTPVNIPPTIRIVSPEEGALLTPPTPIVFRVEASDPDGAIVQVKYHLECDDGDTRWQTSIPIRDPADGWVYEHDWAYVHCDGVHTVRAETIDDDGARVISPTVTFTLNRADQE